MSGESFKTLQTIVNTEKGAVRKMIDGTAGNEMLSPKDVMKLTGLGEKIVYGTFKSPDFPAVLFGKRKYVSKRDLMKWMEKQKNK